MVNKLNYYVAILFFFIENMSVFIVSNYIQFK